MAQVTESGTRSASTHLAFFKPIVSLPPGQVEPATEHAPTEKGGEHGHTDLHAVRKRKEQDQGIGRVNQEAYSHQGDARDKPYPSGDGSASTSSVQSRDHRRIVSPMEAKGSARRNRWKPFTFQRQAHIEYIGGGQAPLGKSLPGLPNRKDRRKQTEWSAL